MYCKVIAHLREEVPDEPGKALLQVGLHQLDRVERIRLLLPWSALAARLEQGHLPRVLRARKQLGERGTRGTAVRPMITLTDSGSDST